MLFVLHWYLPINKWNLCENLSNEVLLFLLSEVGSDSGVGKENTKADDDNHQDQGQETPVLAS